MKDSENLAGNHGADEESAVISREAIDKLVAVANEMARTGRQAEAMASLKEALQIKGDAALHIELGVMLMDAGEIENAAVEFQNAIDLNPSEVTALTNLGNALRLLNRRREAQTAFERALAIDPSNAAAHGNLGNLLRDFGEADAAVKSLQECIRLEPGRPESYAFLGGAALEAGRADEALSALDLALQLDPVNRTAMAYKSAALQEVGNLAAARFLLDLDNLIDARKFATVPGFPSLQTFNEQLATHVAQHPSLSFERTGNATRFGSHTSDLFESDAGLMRTFKKLVDERVAQYFEDRELQPDHPFMAHRMKFWESVAWGVVMREGGHQIPHIHPSAWLSGVYYVKVPSSVRADSENKAGWIEFGSPPQSMRCKRQRLKRFLFPEEGKMILFPSYFYHMTVPLESTEERISIAFDVTPRSAARAATAARTERSTQ